MYVYIYIYIYIHVYIYIYIYPAVSGIARCHTYVIVTLESIGALLESTR